MGFDRVRNVLHLQNLIFFQKTSSAELGMRGSHQVLERGMNEIRPKRMNPNKPRLFIAILKSEKPDENE